MEVEAGRATWYPPEYIEIFHLSERLRRSPQELAPALGLPVADWWWIEAARVMTEAEALYREAVEARDGK